MAGALLISNGSANLATAAIPASIVAPSLLAENSPSRVFITLRSNNLAADASARAKVLAAADSPSAKRARRIASSNPYLFTDQERRAAKSIERSRNEAMSQLRKAAAPDVLASETLASIIKHGGGEVHRATPLPNTITATVSPRLLAAISHNKLVASIAPASDEPHPMSSPVDGSETWHTNGFTGNGPSADGNGGPDYATPDLGVRTTHLAFRTRLPGDPDNGPATGSTRITSPAGRVNFTGSEHGNTVAAIVATTDLTEESGWQPHKGLAYGVDKVYDPYQAKSTWHWLTGVTYLGEAGLGGTGDLPESVNFSVGSYNNTQDFDPAWAFLDGYVATLGTQFSFGAGNCGVVPSTYTGCLSIGDGIKRVAYPGNTFNGITMGGLDYNGDIYNSGVWIPWANSSPGPTWGGRKKPDLLADPFGVASGPNDQNDTTYENTGEGTSYAAPVASAGALLLASSGVYAPSAQKAILINSATPIQGQTYWTPTSGWGAIDLDAAFYQRANYQSSTITPQGENGIRFFRATGVTSGDRSTLVWNRRTATSSTYRALTNLDLSQHNQATGATTAIGGSDAADTVDTNQTTSPANPMPGSGTDGGDNVEQIRSTSSGTQVLKVKNLGSVDGLAAEPFSIASAKPLTALQTPVPEVELEVAPDAAAVGDTVTVTATVTNASSDIALTGAEVTLNPPAGVSITSGSVTQSFGTLATSASAAAVWQVKGNEGGVKTLTATSAGTAYGETFSSAGTDNLTVDSDAPVINVNGPGQWSASANPEFTWSATDSTGVASYDVSTSIGGAAPTLVMNDTTATSGNFTAPEGVSLTVLVSAKDTAGNESAATSTTTTIDAIAPTVSITAPTVAKGTASAFVQAQNIGSPITVTGVVSPNANAPLVPIPSLALVFTNNNAKATAATFRAAATDALGRTATATTVSFVSSRWIAANMKLAKPRSKSGVTTFFGTINKSATGKLMVTVKRIGKRGTARRSAKAALKRGRFSAKLKLAPGRYKASATYLGSATILKTTLTKTVTVK